MQSGLSLLKKNLAYTFLLFGAIWLVVAYVVGSLLVLWPAVACFGAGLLVKLRPASRLSTAWGPSAAVLGLSLCAYQVYEALPLITGVFVEVATASVVVFLLLGLGHLYLLFASYPANAVK